MYIACIKRRFDWVNRRVLESIWICLKPRVLSSFFNGSERMKEFKSDGRMEEILYSIILLIYFQSWHGLWMLIEFVCTNFWNFFFSKRMKSNRIERNYSFFLINRQFCLANFYLFSKRTKLQIELFSVFISSSKIYPKHSTCTNK